MPQPSEHLRDSTGQSTDQPSPAPKSKSAQIDPAKYQHLADKHGIKFDPALHKTNKDGTPKLTADGLLWRKPGARPKRSESRVYRGAPSQGPDSPDLQAEGARYRSTAEVTVATLNQLAVSLGGEDWQFGRVEGIGRDAERAQHIEAWERYYRVRGISELPWWLELSVAQATYVLPRLAAPSTKKRAGRLRAWWGRMVGRRKADKRRPALSPDSGEGADAEGERSA
ncbi:MAG: hypothetical protein GWO16_08340 [Gammaproteobacteria bacterium]|nr:hypothetical protein [Gammaproteobacteria bacterium]NIR97956.1 hypothetical protein [Gammaproteobacteria bacterium]NIT63657.1 hypothetical protein [Gammaproteobacteria bacterium]NIV21515.1 hypothetical protein [Gammaproteobacteria bacterium]NIY32237.1 hypothetical protein [Gammaproteobacteria bacterium]